MNPAIDIKQIRLESEHKHDRPLVSCRFDPTGKYLFFGAQDPFVHRWEVAANQLTKLSGHETWVRAIGFSPDGATLYTGGYDGKLFAWNASDAQPSSLRTVDAHQGWIRALAVSPDGAQIATCGNDGLIKLWNSADFAPVKEFAGHDCHVYSVAFHPIFPAIVSSDLKGKIKQWDLSSGGVSREFDASPSYKYDAGFQADYGGLTNLAFTPDGKRFAGGGISNVSNAFAGVGNVIALRYDFDTGALLKSHVSSAAAQGTVWGVGFVGEGTLVGVSGGQSGGWIFFWNEDAEKEAHLLQVPAVGRDLALHPDGARLAVAAFDGVARVYTMTPPAA